MIKPFGQRQMADSQRESGHDWVAEVKVSCFSCFSFFFFFKFLLVCLSICLVWHSVLFVLFVGHYELRTKINVCVCEQIVFLRFGTAITNWWVMCSVFPLNPWLRLNYDYWFTFLYEWKKGFSFPEKERKIAFMMVSLYFCIYSCLPFLWKLLQINWW